MGMETLTKGKVGRELPTADIDGGRDGEPLRIAQYGENINSPLGAKGLALVDEGSCFVATNPTPGTGIATIAAPTTLVDTAPFLLIQNGNPVSSVKTRIYLEQLKITCTAAGTGGTSIRYAVKTDTSGNRYTSGGSIIVPQCTNRDSDRSSMARIYAGAVVASAATDARLLGHGLLRPVIPVIGDVYVISFGGCDASSTALITSGVAITNVVAGHPAVAIGPGQWAAIHLWLPAQTVASSYEFELSYTER